MSGKRRRGRPSKRFMDVVRLREEDVGLREEDAEDRMKWICCANPNLKQLKVVVVVVELSSHKQDAT